MGNQNLQLTRGATSDGALLNLNVVELGYLTQLAGWDNFNDAANTALRAQGLSLPNHYSIPVRRGRTTVWRIAPDRVLVRSDTALRFESSNDLVVLELSEARICLMLDGAGAAGLLSRVIALDFSEAGFPVGAFVQTALHHVGVLVDRVERDRFAILIPTTWATSLRGFITDHLVAA